MNWIPNIFRRDKIHEDLIEEMQLHIDERTEQLMHQGLTREESERMARIGGCIPVPLTPHQPSASATTPSTTRAAAAALSQFACSSFFSSIAVEPPTS